MRSDEIWCRECVERYNENEPVEAFEACSECRRRWDDYHRNATDAEKDADLIRSRAENKRLLAERDKLRIERDLLGRMKGIADRLDTDTRRE